MFLVLPADGAPFMERAIAIDKIVLIDIGRHDDPPNGDGLYWLRIDLINEMAVLVTGPAASYVMTCLGLASPNRRKGVDVELTEFPRARGVGPVSCWE